MVWITVKDRDGATVETVQRNPAMYKARDFDGFFQGVTYKRKLYSVGRDNIIFLHIPVRGTKVETK